MLELLLSQAWVLAQGGAIGFLVAAAIGPIAMLCIRTTLERGRIAGPQDLSATPEWAKPIVAAAMRLHAGRGRR